MTDLPAPRHSTADREKIPTALVRGMAALALSSLALVAYATITDRPLVAVAPTENAVLTRELVLTGDLSGAARVTAPDGALIADLAPEEGGFVAGLARVIERERTLRRLPLEGPVTVIGHADGRISIQDPATGWRADLMGFGADNAEAFARLLVTERGDL